MATRSRILLLHSDPTLREALKAALGETVADLTEGSIDDVRRRLAEGGVDLIVAEEKVGVSFLEELSRCSPATPRAILLNGGDRRTWVEAAAEGHQFTAIPERAPDLAPRLRALVDDHAAPPRGLSSCTAEVRAGDGAVALSGHLLHVTSDSLRIRVELGDGLDHFLPGRQLDRVVVRRGRVDLLDAVAPSVHGLRPDAAGGYELQLLLGAAPPPPSRGEEIVREALHRASVIEEAIRRQALRVERIDRGTASAVVRGRVDAIADMLFLIDPPPEFAPGACVRFSFESGGAHFRFVAALSEHESHGARHVVALLPSELRGHRRWTPRIRLAPGEGHVELRTLLGAETVRRSAADVEMEGIGFTAEPGDLLPIGTRLPSLTLVLAGGATVRAAGRVVSRRALESGSGPRAVRCGVRLDPLTPEAQSTLADVIVGRTHPGLELARGLGFDAVWCFLRETGFLYAEKEQQLRPSLPEIRTTMTRLLAHPEGPLRTLVFRAPAGDIQGHVSVVRAYQRTWMLQHLAVRKDGGSTMAAARALNQGIIDYLEHLPDAEWIRIWFRPKNRYPARTFGRFARVQFDHHRNHVKTYAYYTAPSEGAPELALPGATVAEATAADWADIRRHFVARGETALLSAEDLCGAADLSQMDDAYREIGLTRRREALVARRDGRLLGFALLEISSPGINLSDITTAFRMHAAVNEPAVVSALAAAARRRYADLGRPLAIGLHDAPDDAAWREAGFTHVKEYSCMTGHRSLWRRYVEFVSRLYECVPALVKRPPA